MLLRLFRAAATVLLLAGSADSFAKEAVPQSYDVVIYGGTSAAITTAVEVKRSGKSVAIVCPERHLGGLTAGGLGWTDSGNKAAIGGLSRNFYHRVWQHYQSPRAWQWQSLSEFGGKNQTPSSKKKEAAMWVFEPHVAEQIFETLVAEHEIPVFRDQWLDRTVVNAADKRTTGVEVSQRKIVSIRMQSGLTFAGRMFVDATYEGDLMAAAGVRYHVGREANSVYDEQWNGVQIGTLHHAHFFSKPTAPYIVAGDASSGLLPKISSEPPGNKGEGDHRIQAYCFRMCLTNVTENRLPFSKPEGYDPKQYELLLRVFDQGWRSMFNKFDPLPNHKTDTNNHGPFSTDNIGMNYDYPDGSYERRREINREHENYQKGLMYFMANNPRVPLDVRSKMSMWGLAKDEFLDNDGWPHQIYVREARRMIGHYVMTEHDCLDAKETPQSVGMGSYTLDSHNVQRYVKPDGTVQNEGDIGVHAPRPYEIAYGSIIPKKDECQNLFVPVCVSSSHIAFGSIRMEPVFMILGQSAGAAACIAIDDDIAVQEVDYQQLKERLLDAGQVLHLDIATNASQRGVSPKELEGIVVDDDNAEIEGAWGASHTISPFVGNGYRHDADQTKGQNSVTFRTELTSGRYRVRISFPANPNRATNVPVTITHARGQDKVAVNQRVKPTSDDMFTAIGDYFFADSGTVRIGTEGTSGHVIADAVQFLPLEINRSGE